MVPTECPGWTKREADLCKRLLDAPLTRDSDAARIGRRDVKPENLLCERIDGVDIVKLADFGSASLISSPDGMAPVDSVAQGTTLYSPPEVLSGPAYSTASDMWAAGITT